MVARGAPGTDVFVSDSKIRSATKQKFHFLKRAAGEGENPYLGCSFYPYLGCNYDVITV